MFISFKAFLNSLLWDQENSYGSLDQKIVMVSLQIFIYLLRWWWRKNLKASEFFYRWKIHEACMLALGSVKSIITDSVKNGRIHFDMHGFLTNVVLADLNLSGTRDLVVTQRNCWVQTLEISYKKNLMNQVAASMWWCEMQLCTLYMWKGMNLILWVHTCCQV